jgi:short-subunit dehydrogenase
MKLANRTAVVTGAASGIGRGIALTLARRGCHLALADLNEEGLGETKAMIKDDLLRVSLHRLDVADRQSVADLPKVVLSHHSGVDLLINNAGVALGGTFEQISEQDFEWLFEINFWGLVRLTRAFLPILRASKEARLVNISSLYGLIAPAEQTAYAASKFAVRGFSQALKHELAGTSIGVTLVHPGGVATAIAQAARAPKGAPPEEEARRRASANRLLKMPPAQAGEIIVRGIEQRKARIIVGTDAKVAALVERLFPASYWSFLRWYIMAQS